jgi:hypothetical protein
LAQAEPGGATAKAALAKLYDLTRRARGAAR